MTEHKHAEVLRAIADGKEVEYSVDGRWWPYATSPNPLAHPKFDWRVKPKPDVVDERRLYWNKAYRGAIDDAIFNRMPHFESLGNFRLVFDGETGKLKSAVVLE